MPEVQLSETQQGQIKLLEYRIDALEKQLKDGFSLLGEKLDSFLEKQGSQLAINATYDSRLTALMTLYESCKEQINEYKVDLKEFKEREEKLDKELRDKVDASNLNYAKIAGIAIGSSAVVGYLFKIISF